MMQCLERPWDVPISRSVVEKAYRWAGYRE